MPLTNHIAIYGGSFNPPHMGHQIACMWLLEALNAEKVLVVPTYEHYFGKKLERFDYRVEMCLQMISPFPQDKIIVSDIEANLPKPNTTLKLVEAVKEFYDTVAVVIGTDLIPSLHKWHNWDQVAELARIVAVGRTGYSETDSPFDIYKYPIELSAVSSSDIRKYIINGLDITGMVPAKIKQYIEENNLYVQDDSGAGQS